MAKLHRVGQFSRPQFVFVSLLIIFASLTLTNTLKDTTPPNEKTITLNICQSSNPLVKKLLDATNEALNVSKIEATKFFQDVLHRTYEDAMQNIHNLTNDWRVVLDLPKQPGQSVIRKFSDSNVTADQELLLKLYNDSVLVRRGVWERKLEAYEMKFRNMSLYFGEFLKEIDKVSQALTNLIPGFKLVTPKIENPEIPRKSLNQNEINLRNSQITHDYIIFLEYTNDFAKQINRDYCGYSPT